MTDPRQFSPIPWQVPAWRDTSSVMLCAGGAGSGKSVMGLHKINALCMRFPGYLQLLLRKSRQSLRNSSIPQLESIVGPQVQHLKSEFRFQYPNGSRIVYGGMFDAKQREAIRSVAGEHGSGADGALLEEASAFTEADFEEIMGRMRGQAAGWTQIALYTNPDSETHWINQRMVRPFLAGARTLPGSDGELSLSCYFPRPEDNPLLRPVYIASLRSLTGVRRARLYEGRWVRAEGTVYDCWDPNRHIIDPFPIPKDWRRIRVCDFGFVNPRVCLWIAIDHDGGMFVYREIYRTKQRASEFAKEIKRRSAGELIEATICDHDADERAELEAAGIPTVAAIKDKTTGIQATTDRIAADRLHIFRECLVERDEELVAAHKPWCTAQEVDCYVWDRKPDGTVNKEEPKKENDHGMDTLRYGVMYEDKGAIDPANVDEETIKAELARARREFGSSPHHGSGFGSGGGSRWM